MPLSAIASTDFKPRSPNEAVRIFARKSLLTGTAARAIRGDARRRAVRAAAIHKSQVISAAMDIIRQAIRKGESFATTQQRLMSLFSSVGVDGIPLHRLRLIMRQSTLTAYNVARHRVQFSEPIQQAFPYLQYLTVGDPNVRPEHGALHGRIFRKDDPIWDRIYPPWGFNCRCFTRDVSARELQRQGGAKRVTEGEYVLTRMRVPGQNERGIKVPPEFDHPRDQYQTAEIISQVEPSLRQLVERAINARDNEPQQEPPNS